MAFPFLPVAAGALSLYDILKGGRSTSQSYKPSPWEIEIMNILRPSLTYGGALGEVQRGLQPQIQGFQNLARTAGAPYGGGAEIASTLKGGSMINDLLAQVGLQRQQQAQGTFASLAGGRGTTTTTPPRDFGSLGMLLGYYLLGQGNKGGGLNLGNLPAFDRGFGGSGGGSRMGDYPFSGMFG